MSIFEQLLSSALFKLLSILRDLVSSERLVVGVFWWCCCRSASSNCWKKTLAWQSGWSLQGDLVVLRMRVLRVDAILSLDKPAASLFINLPPAYPSRVRDGPPPGKSALEHTLPVCSSPRSVNQLQPDYELSLYPALPWSPFLRKRR